MADDEGEKTMKYSNPRMQAMVNDWPSGGRRVMARFYIEQVPGKGERAVRKTEGKPGQPTPRPKKLTYANKARIVDGDDGRIYIAELLEWGRKGRAAIKIMKGTMDFRHEYFDDDDPGYAEVLSLFDENRR